MSSTNKKRRDLATGLSAMINMANEGQMDDLMRPAQKVRPVTSVNISKPKPTANSTLKLDSPNEQSSQTVQPDSSSGQFNRTVQTVQMNSSNEQLDSSNEQFMQTVALSDQAVQMNSSNEQFNETTPLNESVPVPAIKNRLHQQEPKLRSPAQKKLANYLRKMGTHITTYALIVADTGIPYGTVRRLLKQFTTWGMVKAEKYYGDHNKQGLLISVLGLPKLDEETNQTAQVNTSNEQFNRTVQPPLLDSKIDISSLSIYQDQKEPSPPLQQTKESMDGIKPKLLALTKDDYNIFWPNLSAIGWGPSQTEQCIVQLEKIERSIEGLRDALTHADAALEMGTVIVKATGKAPDNPLNYIFSSIRRSGYYSPPPGYKTPEQQRLEDLLAKQKAEQKLCEALELAEQAEQSEAFDSWWKELDIEEQHRIMKEVPSQVGTGFDLRMRWVRENYYPTLKN